MSLVNQQESSQWRDEYKSRSPATEMSRMPMASQLHQKQWQRSAINKVVAVHVFFNAKTVVERGRLLEQLGGCWICTSWKNSVGGCQQRRGGVVRGMVGKRCEPFLSQSEYCHADNSRPQQSSKVVFSGILNHIPD